MRNIFIFTFLSFLLASITTTAFEDDTKVSSPKIVYKLNADLDDLVLNYCSSYDSYTVNRLYSQKKIIDENLNKRKKILVSIKKKPLDPNLVKLINKKENLNIAFKNINELDLDFLSKNKKDFVKTLLPLISYENQNILLERSKLETIKAFLSYNRTLSSSDLNFINRISKKYRFKSKGKHKLDVVNELLELVDVIPNSIVLAQAANESGWGTSRFAREGNALFGEWTWQKDIGIKPQEKLDANYSVKSFTNITESLNSYILNLNRHDTYKEMRSYRYKKIKNGNEVSGYETANFLDGYAEIGHVYVTKVKEMIKSNKLYKFDNLQLD